LGPTPLANSFLETPAEFATELQFPLDLYFCEECSLVQLLDVIDPEVLFRNYIYVTGTSDTITAHNESYAETVTQLLCLRADDLVVEVASNNGQLLQSFKRRGVRTLGIEPAENIAAIARAAGVETISEFFDSAIAPKVLASYGPAKAVIGNNVLAHVDNTKDFLLGCKSLLAPDGLVIIEVPYLRDFLNHLEYDTVYHEHLCYFSVTSLMHMCDAVGLSLVRVDHVPVHGGSLRIYAAHQESHREHAPEVRRVADEERAAGMSTFATYEQFACDVQGSRKALLELLCEIKQAGKTVAGYGAPAKGNTLLNFCGIDSQQLTFTVDKNPLKVGLYTPGTHIPVQPVAAVLEKQPDYLLILAWNFADEIMRQQVAYQERGGRFIIPIPKAKVI
jgi:hypothetical protein